MTLHRSDWTDEQVALIEAEVNEALEWARERAFALALHAVEEEAVRVHAAFGRSQVRWAVSALEGVERRIKALQSERRFSCWAATEKKK